MKQGLYCRFTNSCRLLLVAAVILGFATAVHADTFVNSNAINPGNFMLSTEPEDWLLIGTDKHESGTTVSVNSGFELGAHLPTDGIPSSQNPSLSGVTKPTGAVDPTIGIGLNGDTALIRPDNTFNFQTIDGEGLLNGTTGRSGVYGDTGVQCSQGQNNCTDGNSNTFFNDVGTFPMPNTPLSNSNGIVGGDTTTLQALEDGLEAARGDIAGLPSGGTLDGGTFPMDLFITLNQPGLHVLDVENDGNDWDLGNFDIVIDGPADSYLIVRIPDGVNMLTSNSWIGIGGGGIGTNNVLFFTDQDNNNGHFNFQNTLFNGVAFWDLSDDDGADVALDNGQGCAQFVGEQIVMNDVRLNNCGFQYRTEVVPEPSTLLFFGTGLVGLGFIGWRRRRSNAS